MMQSLFDGDWLFRRDAADGDVSEQAVRLPHDAMLVEGRAADAPSGAHGGYFLGGRYVYTKRWTVPEELRGQRLSLLFEGVQGSTRVLLNGVEVGGSDGGYTEFEVDLAGATPTGENTIEVRVDNSAQPSSRWYTGSGIYRPVWLLVRGAASFAFDGLRFTTVRTDREVELELAFAMDGAVPADAEVRVALHDGEQVVADHAAPVVAGRVRFAVPDARLWSAADPHRYRAEVQLVSDGEVLDAERVPVGLRTVEVRATRGLLVNGQVTLLRGACIHHDSGPLGAATFRAAEFRRARILKENGYNAIRSSHNPLSRDLLDACDELGLYVIDELTDVWTVPKTAHDAARRFAEHWPADLASMVAKDRNRPSVIMYSIGNEIAETAKADGVALTGELSRAVRALDPTRPTTQAINFLLNVMAGFDKSPFSQASDPAAQHASTPPKPASKATSTAANVVTNKIGAIQGLIARLPQADKLTRESFAQVDVAGYNYAASRYAADRRRHPRRIIVGSETMPGDIARNWSSVERLPNVIGDFAWTGWDYLGEAGLGSWSYGEDASVMNQPYPHVVAGCGAIDITGLPGAPALLSRAVWGELDAPAIAVRPLDRAGQKTARSAWRSTDAVSSWSWRGKTGVDAEIEVYSAMEEVELLLNGRSLGRKRAGARHGFLARFRTPYQSGELVAIGRSGRMERRALLRSAVGDLQLRLTADRTALAADGQDLAFVRVEVVDAAGTVEMLADDRIRVEVEGAGVLAALGTGSPGVAESFLADSTETYYGRALAIVRTQAQPGPVTVRVTGERLGAAEVVLQAGPVDAHALASDRGVLSGRR